MNDAFLEVQFEKITVADFEKYQLPIPAGLEDNVLKLVFSSEDDFCSYLKELEKESDSFLSQYWMFKTPELIEKNKFIMKILTLLNMERSRKYDYKS